METAFACENPHLRASIDVMRRTSADTRGTIQSLAAEVDDANVDGEHGLDEPSFLKLNALPVRWSQIRPLARCP
jgi:hypothetical protein